MILILPWIFYCIGLIMGPLCFHEFASCYFYQVFAVVPLLVCTDCAGKGPHFSKVLKAQNKAVGVPWILFLLGVNYVRFFPIPTQLHLSIFSTVVCLPIFPVHSLESAVSTIPYQVLLPNCKRFSAVNRNRNRW